MARWLQEKAIEISIIAGAEKAFRREMAVGDIKILHP
jgi:hypothetical protein